MATTTIFSSHCTNNGTSVGTNINLVENCEYFSTTGKIAIDIDFTNLIIVGGIFLLVFTFAVFVQMFSDIKKYG
jgi:hypothetical protein